MSAELEQTSADVEYAMRRLVRLEARELSVAVVGQRIKALRAEIARKQIELAELENVEDNR